MIHKATRDGIVRGGKSLLFRSAAIVLLLIVWRTAATSGQKPAEAVDSTVMFSARATHVLGFEGAKKNSQGMLSIQNRVLQFQKGSDAPVQLPIGSITGVFLGDANKQVGGLPMTLGKAAVPFGGGRVVSLFAHKKYDTVTLEYVSDDGGIHGAIFEIMQGQGKLFRDQLVAMREQANGGHEGSEKNVSVATQTAPPKSSAVSEKSQSPLWSVQIKTIDPGDVGISASFQTGIYESLLTEVKKTNKFKDVLRDGERTSSEVPDLLILRTTVEKYEAGSETKRAVTTVKGATKITVRSQLCTRDGQIVFERTINGNVRFMGSNLRATHNLGRNVAKAVKQSSLPAPSMSALTASGKA